MTPEARALVERLLEDWEQDQYQIYSEWGVGKAEYDAMKDEIAARRAEWAALAKTETT